MIGFLLGQGGVAEHRGGRRHPLHLVAVVAPVELHRIVALRHAQQARSQGLDRLDDLAKDEQARPAERDHSAEDGEQSRADRNHDDAVRGRTGFGDLLLDRLAQVGLNLLEHVERGVERRIVCPVIIGVGGHAIRQRLGLGDVIVFRTGRPGHLGGQLVRVGLAGHHREGAVQDVDVLGQGVACGLGRRRVVLLGRVDDLIDIALDAVVLHVGQHLAGRHLGQDLLRLAVAIKRVLQERRRRDLHHADHGQDDQTQDQAFLDRGIGTESHDQAPPPGLMAVRWERTRTGSRGH